MELIQEIRVLPAWTQACSTMWVWWPQATVPLWAWQLANESDSVDLLCKFNLISQALIRYVIHSEATCYIRSEESTSWYTWDMITHHHEKNYIFQTPASIILNIQHYCNRSHRGSPYECAMQDCPLPCCLIVSQGLQSLVWDQEKKGVNAFWIGKIVIGLLLLD